MSDHFGRHDPEWPDDETARRLRDALSGEAASIQPSPDGLAQIRERIGERRRGPRAWARPLAVSAAALGTAAVAAIAVVVVPSSGSHHEPGVTTASSPSSSGSPTTTASTPAAPSTVSSPAPSDTKTNPVAIFYVGKEKDPQQLLYREVVTRPYPADKSFIQTAVTAMLTTPPTDQDYVSYWPAGATVLGVSIHGSQAVVDLSAQAGNPSPDSLGMGAISAQQLFYTVNAAAPKITSVDLHIDGQPVDSLWGTKITNPITGEPAAQVWAHVWITSPIDGATVASTFTFGGEATTFESGVTWQILMNGEVLKQDSALASPPSSMPATDYPTRGTWQVTVTLGTPGTYEIRAFEASAKDGSPTYVDTKTITVK